MRLERVRYDDNYTYSQPTRRRSTLNPIFQGFLIMVIFVFVGIVLSYGLGTGVDVMYESIYDSGVMDVEGDWEGMAEEDAGTVLSIFYLSLYIIPTLGVVLFLYTVLQKQKYDREG